LVAPTLVTTTTVPAGNVPVTPLLVTDIGVPVDVAVKPEMLAETEALTGSGFPELTAWQFSPGIW
jgi:hypothetical protein